MFPTKRIFQYIRRIHYSLTENVATADMSSVQTPSRLPNVCMSFIYPTAFYFRVVFNLVIFASRQKFAEIKPTTINPRIGKVFLLFAMSQCGLEWQCTLLFTEKDIGSGS